MRHVVRAVVATAALALVLGLVWFLGMRTKAPVVLGFQRRVNRAIFNPRQMRSAGTPGAYAGIVRHRGRRTGNTYETPVVPLPFDGGFVIVLPYGSRTDWVDNVMAAGAATIIHEGEVHEVDRPEVVSVDASPHDFAAGERRTMALFGNDECLVLRHSAD